MYRAAIWVVWRNYLKSRSENRRNSPPAELLGWSRKRLTVEEILGSRLFPSRIKLSNWVKRCYEGRIPTRRLANIRVHQPKFAESESRPLLRARFRILKTQFSIHLSFYSSRSW